MELLEAIAMRKSIRHYKQEQIKEEELDTILKAGCAAPIGHGKNELLHLTVLQDASIRKELSIRTALLRGTPDYDPLYAAPTIIVVSAQSHEKYQNAEYASTACIIENMLLAATDLKIGSVYLWGAALALRLHQELSQKLGIPDSFVPISCVALGYADIEDDVCRELKLSISTNWI